MCGTQPQTQTQTTPPSIADIVREETDNGRLIVRVLIDIALGQGDEIKTCHQLEATRQLAALGVEIPQAVIQAAAKPAKPRTRTATPTAPTRTASSSQNNELADIIKQETSNGRDIVRFLVDVMQGNLDGFKPCHRLAAAKELVRRGFDSTPGHTNDEYEDHDDFSSPNYVDPNTNRYNNEDDPFDFENYDEEQYRRDGQGGRVLRHIYGDRETMIVAIDAANKYLYKDFSDDGIADRDFTPVEDPEDDPYGKGCYGYNALRFRFPDNEAIRAANKAVEEYKKRKAEHSGGESENEGPPVDRPSCCFPQPTAPSSYEEDDTMPPDHWSLKYMERLRNRSIETDESSKDPDPDESEPIQPPENSDRAGPEPHQSSKDPVPPLSVTPERPQNPPVGAGFKPARGLAHPSTDRDSERPDVILERPPVILERSEEPPAPSSPPRKRPVRIFTGPPDENPRQCRDPGDFQSEIDSIRPAATLLTRRESERRTPTPVHANRDHHNRHSRE